MILEGKHDAFFYLYKLYKVSLWDLAELLSISVRGRRCWELKVSSIGSCGKKFLAVQCLQGLLPRVYVVTTLFYLSVQVNPALSCLIFPQVDQSGSFLFNFVSKEHVAPNFWHPFKEYKYFTLGYGKSSFNFNQMKKMLDLKDIIYDDEFK